MTHSDIYTKYMIEYDKAQITSSYPSLTKYETATILDKAYLALIAQKFTGNNQRGVPFEGDLKAIEDIRPLIKTDSITSYLRDIEASNGVVYNVPAQLLYYIQAKIDLGTTSKTIDHVSHSLIEVRLVSHEDASKFMNTTHNLPWVDIPVACMEDNQIRVFLDPVNHVLTLPQTMFLTYVSKPAKFAVGDGTKETDYDFGSTTFELSDTMAEELINLAIIMTTETVESPRLNTELQTRPLES